MAEALAGITAAQAAQQKLPEPAAQPAKQGPSKFDKALSTQAESNIAPLQQVQPVSQAQAANKANKVDSAPLAGQVAKTDKARMSSARIQALSESSSSRTAAPSTQTQAPLATARNLMSLMDGVEKGQASLDKIIGSALQGKQFSNAELLSLQASMYKYSQEMDLTSKIVEKTTTGLKETLRTQV